MPFSFSKIYNACTRILKPLKRKDVDSKEWIEIVENIKKINEKMLQFFKTNIKMDFIKVLEELEISEEEYIRAIRTSIKTETIFLKRNSFEVGINAYNIHLLNLIQSNMDIQSRGY